MGSCAAPSAKGDDKFITTDYLQQCHGGTMSQLNPPGFLYRNALIYMGWLLSKTDYTSKGTNLYVTTP
ncbi:hypothetical protein FV108_27880, partial [Klebsiella pneumoniae]|uniref:hypothetical protein n=1 Tax=Klebsiella pneumoniae TaxID=573 RepID=UPI00135EBC4E